MYEQRVCRLPPILIEYECTEFELIDFGLRIGYRPAVTYVLYFVIVIMMLQIALASFFRHPVAVD